jgi:septal ring factor EnvC (AmiA/AmiB activator)
VIACLGLFAVPAAPSAAQSIEELNTRIAGAEGQASSLGAQIEAQGAELADAQARAQAAAAREAELSAVLARGQEREAALEAEVAEARTALRAAREQLGRALDVLAERLVGIYRSDTPDPTSLLLQADGFDDLASRADLLGRIQEADSALVERVRALRAAVATELARTEDAEARAAAFNREVEAARSQIATVRASAESEAAALAAARERQRSTLASLQAQVGDWTAEVQRLEQISAAQAQQVVAGWFGDWAIPQAIVMCESGGNFGAINPSSGAGGAYQILPSTWQMYGGRGAPQNASPAEQHRIASQIWSDSGSAAWVCAG